MKRIVFVVILCSLMLSTAAIAQPEPVKLLGRHTITIEGGTKTNSNTSVIVNGGDVDVKSGFIGSLNYGYWFDEEWAVTLSVGGFGMGAKTTFNNVETSSVMPILFGVKYYPQKLAMGAVGRVYAGLAAGSYMGFATKVQNFFSTKAISESVFGGQVSVGMDFFVASWFRLGPKLAYHLMGDFSEVIGTKKNLSGAAFSLEFGVVL